MGGERTPRPQDTRGRDRPPGRRIASPVEEDELESSLRSTRRGAAVAVKREENRAGFHEWVQ